MSEPIRSLRPGAEPPSLDEQLQKAPQHRNVVRLNPDEAGALFVRLARLEAIEQRVREMIDPLCHCGGCTGCNARYLLGET